MPVDVNKKRQEEVRIVRLMIEVYCKKKHKTKGALCAECKELAEYAALRTSKCPFMETKTFCSACKVHCYAPEKKEKIKEVMRFSGPRMLWHHPVLAVKHAYVTIKNVRSKKKCESQNVQKIKKCDGKIEKRI